MTVSLYNKSNAFHAVVAQGTEVLWAPQTVQVFTEEEAAKISKYEHVVSEQEILGTGTASLIEKKNAEIEALKAQLAAAKEEPQKEAPKVAAKKSSEPKSEAK